MLRVVVVFVGKSASGSCGGIWSRPGVPVALLGISPERRRRREGYDGLEPVSLPTCSLSLDSRQTVSDCFSVAYQTRFG